MTRLSIHNFTVFTLLGAVGIACANSLPLEPSPAFPESPRAAIDSSPPHADGGAEELLQLINPITSRPVAIATPCSGRFEDMADQGSVFERTAASELAVAADGRLQDTVELVAAGEVVADLDPDTKLSALLIWALRGCSVGVEAVLPASVFPNSLDSADVLRAAVEMDDLLLVEQLFRTGVDANGLGRDLNHVGPKHCGI